MNRTVIIFATAAVIVAVVVIAMIYSSQIPIKTEFLQVEGPAEKLVIAFLKHPFAAPIAVAHAKGFFRDEGLETALLPFAPGSSGIDAVLTGQAGLICSADPTVVKTLMEGHPLKVAAVISTSEMALSIVALREKGVDDREDLRGKRIGVTPGTSGEFNLHVLLTLNRIPLTEVHLVELNPDEMERAIIDGEVDAISASEPYTTRLMEKLGLRAVQFYNTPPITVSHSILVPQEIIDGNPLLIEKALRALIRAENFMREKPGDACAITAEYTETDVQIMCKIWNHYDYAVKLDQNLIVRFEVLARWLMGRTGSGTDVLPNFLDYIYTDGLMAADPGKVTLVHSGSL
jgi:NitT/TauT family transport system substrate-binding protein